MLSLLLPQGQVLPWSTMEGIGIREFRQNASKYLYDRLVAEGKIIPGRQDWGEFFDNNPPSTSENPRSTSEFLQELREERLP